MNRRLEALEDLGNLTSLCCKQGGEEGNNGSESDPLVNGEILVEEDESNRRHWDGQKEDPDLRKVLSLSCCDVLTQIEC